MGLLPDRQNCGLRMRRECRERFPRHRLQKKPLVSDPGIHHGTYVTHAHVGIAITCRGGEYIPGIPGVCATLNFIYLVRGPCMEVWCNVSRTHPRHGDLPFRYVTLSHVTNNKNSWAPFPFILHYCDVIMGAVPSQITSITIVHSTVYSDADQRKHQSSASLAICVGNSPGTGEFPAQMASNAENVSIWWRHHVNNVI